MKKDNIILLAIVLALSTVLRSHAQGLLRDYLEVEYAKSMLEGRFRITKVVNHYSKAVELSFINQYDVDSVSQKPANKIVVLEAGKSLGNKKKPYDVTCNIFRARVKNAKDRSSDTDMRVIDFETKKDLVAGWDKKVSTKKPEPVKSEEPKKPEPVKPEEPKKPLHIDTLRARFATYLDDKAYFLSLRAIRSDSDSIEAYIAKMGEEWTDSREFAKKKNLAGFSRLLNDSINLYNSQKEDLVGRFLALWDSSLLPQSSVCRDSLTADVAERINLRDAMSQKLIDNLPVKEKNEMSAGWLVAMICAGMLLMFAVVALWHRKKTRKTIDKVKHETEELITPPAPVPVLPANAPKTVQGPTDATTAGLVVKGSLTPMPLKKQDISDVIDNASYLKIDCRDFCIDSAVGTIYVKNSCIKDIYNMYADDLRDASKMNEDGCMVIGRWVRHEDTGLYDVTLEEIVRPGDDAVFSEYELNFGGKIKLKLGDRLRRLRQGTNLQYDLTCWVHSHPGLGVFFSYSDDNVHRQLDIQTHPLSLTAFVVDILTDKQDVGVFTFKQDGTINSKGDLTRMYSLEEWFRWAVDSVRRNIKPEDYFNTLFSADDRKENCHGVHLGNGAAVDIALLVVEQRAGFVATVFGFVMENGKLTECIVNKVKEGSDDTTGDIALGCMLITTYLSLPTVRKVTGERLNTARFVLVYSTADNMLTTIPVDNGKLCDDEKYYGEIKLEKLKQWTKRRR